ncbi:hypothetical protein, partial [Vibrio parahaemolyticus]|uniref:hypothetical protein n=1 Tax=Vibrio parahaemolyticus TaxID=670 RepID=UPI001EE9FC27
MIDRKMLIVKSQSFDWLFLCFALCEDPQYQDKDDEDVTQANASRALRVRITLRVVRLPTPSILRHLFQSTGRFP